MLGQCVKPPPSFRTTQVWCSPVHGEIFFCKELFLPRILPVRICPRKAGRNELVTTKTIFHAPVSAPRTEFSCCEEVFLTRIPLLAIRPRKVRVGGNDLVIIRPTFNAPVLAHRTEFSCPFTLLDSTIDKSSSFSSELTRTRLLLS